MAADKTNKRAELYTKWFDAQRRFDALYSQRPYCPQETLDAAEIEARETHAEYMKIVGETMTRLYGLRAMTHYVMDWLFSWLDRGAKV